MEERDMRDVRKNQEYFSSYLDYQYSRVEKKTGKFKESSGEKKQRILTSLTGYETDLLKAEFSAGASKEDLKVLLIRAIEIASEYKSITYEDFLVLLFLWQDIERDFKMIKLEIYFLKWKSVPSILPRTIAEEPYF